MLSQSSNPIYAGAATRRDHLRRRVRNAHRAVKMAWMHVLWKTLWFLHLGRVVQRGICRLGVYHQYQPGVCGWCGKPHVDAERFYKRHPWARGGNKGA